MDQLCVAHDDDEWQMEQEEKHQERLHQARAWWERTKTPNSELLADDWVLVPEAPRQKPKPVQKPTKTTIAYRPSAKKLGWIIVYKADKSAYEHVW